MKSWTKAVLALVSLLCSVGHAGAQQSSIDKMDPLSRMFLFPTTEEFATPADLHLNGEPIEFRNEAGHQLRGWTIRSENAEQTIMICPGNAANISVFLPYARIFVEGGYNVFLFDYQGYGKSEGIPSFMSLTGDVTAAYAFLTEEKKVAPEKIGVFGVSLGSTLSIYLAARHPVSALAVEDTFVPNDMLEAFESSQEPNALVKMMLNTVRNGLLSEVDPMKNIEQISCPTFFLHGQLDHFLPPSSSCRVCDAARCQKRMWIMKGVGHAPESLEINDREYAHQLQSFFADAFADRVDDDEPTVSWAVKQELGNADNADVGPREFKTSIQVRVDSRSPIEIALMNGDNQSVVLRRVCEANTVVIASTLFEPTYVSAIKCRYVLDGTKETWEPDLSKLSKDREAFARISIAFREACERFLFTNADNRDKQTTIALWNQVHPLLPEPDQVHPHIRPYYVSMAARAAIYSTEANIDQVIPIWERVLKYLPDHPSKYYRLGNAWFRLGFKETSTSIMLRRWARIELVRGDIDRAHELLRLHVEVSRPEWTPINNAVIPEIQTVEQFDRAFKAADK